jgi:hypothetical protein
MKEGGVVVADGLIAWGGRKLRDGADWPFGTAGASASEGADEITKRYFEGCYDLFLVQAKKMRHLRRPLTEAEEKELRFMLETLIREKRVIYGRE